MRRPVLPLLVCASIATASLASGGPPPSSSTKAPPPPAAKPALAASKAAPALSASKAAPAPSVALPAAASSAKLAVLPAAKPGAKPPVVAAKGPIANATAKPKAVAMLSGWAPPSYVAMVKKWHVPSGKAPVDAAGRPKLVLSSINGLGRVELSPLGDRGGFAPVDLDRVSHLLRSSDGAEHPIDARLLDIAYALQRHFGAGEIRFLSGYRAPKRLGSNHGYGRAIDLVVPGATDEEVATYARSLGFVGVGIYPTSGFVHLDVRDRSFFWVDRSGPGKPNKTVGILAGDAAAVDAAARKAGAVGLPAAKIGRDVEASLAAHAKALGSAAPPAATEDVADDDDH
ncbi:MAG: DUF882 domain-containing protein [Deltaproteobacteria bacterium]|nr:DUF882 domain-containing protein [Deltaproteobacteria bacterium]